MRSVSRYCSLIFLIATGSTIVAGCGDSDPIGGTNHGSSVSSSGGGGQGGDAGGQGGAGAGGLGGSGGTSSGGGGVAGGGGSGGPGCGNGIVEGTEQCDDGNAVPGDCCNGCVAEAGCEIERNDAQADANTYDVLAMNGTVFAVASSNEDRDWYRFTVPAARKATIVAETIDGKTSHCANFAIDSELSLVSAAGALLAHDDNGGTGLCAKLEHGPLDPGDYFIEARSSSQSEAAPFDYGLALTMTLYECGDGLVSPISGEACDDENTTNGDGCDASCHVELGWACSNMLGAPSICSMGCGNGTIGPNETCDDGNNASEDGCSAACALEAGYQCPAPNVACTWVCGDGVRAVGKEGCDDGNTASSDGCDASCQTELGWEIESNDALGQENNFGAIALSGSVKGYVNPSTDVDRYRVTIPPGGTGKIIAETHDGTATTCVSKKIDTEIRILDPQGFTLKTDDDSGIGYCSKAIVTGLPSGDYTVIVDVSPAQPLLTFDYSLSIEAFLSVCGNGQLDPGEECDNGASNGNGPVAGKEACTTSCQSDIPTESEPNDTAPTADGPFLLDARIRGVLEPSTDVDYFAIDVPTVVNLSLETFDVFGPGTCDGLDTTLSLYGPDGTALLATDENGGVGACSWLEPLGNAAMRQLLPGTYFVRVASGGGPTSGAYKLDMKFTAVCGNGVVEPYEQCDGTPDCTQLCKHVMPCGNSVLDVGETCDDGNAMSGDGCSAMCQIEGFDLEPNNTIAQANMNGVVVTGDQVLVGSIGNVADRDIFKLSLSSPTVVRLETFDATGMDCLTDTVTLRILDMSGTELYVDEDSGISSCGAMIRLLPAGTYYVQVEETNVDGTIGEYHLEIKTQLSLGNESPSNDTPMTAMTMTGSDVYIVGGHHSGTDIDYYAVTVSAGESIRAEIIEGAGASCDTLAIDSRLELFDSALVSLAVDDDGGRGYCSRIDGTGSLPEDPGASFAGGLAAGTYLLAVKASPYATMAAADFDYRLVVTIR